MAKGSSGNVWVLVPLAALMIPIISVGAPAGAGFWAVLGLALALGGGTLAGRHLLTHRHQLRMIELEARERLLAEERAQLEAANRILDADASALRRDLGRPSGPVAGA